MGGPDAPAKPILYVNDTTEPQKARALLERFHIDFDLCRTSDPYILLSWSGITYRDPFGVLDSSQLPSSVFSSLVQIAGCT